MEFSAHIGKKKKKKAIQMPTVFVLVLIVQSICKLFSLEIKGVVGDISVSSSLHRSQKCHQRQINYTEEQQGDFYCLIEKNQVITGNET